jgi:MerR family transcriptional regulator, heat shock protein HspR
MADRSGRDPGRGVYGITTAAELAGVSPPTLRLYEQNGLITPQRTTGGTRRYSDDDLDRLHRIGELVAMGINQAGIAKILELEADNDRLRAD